MGKKGSEGSGKENRYCRELKIRPRRGDVPRWDGTYNKLFHRMHDDGFYLYYFEGLKDHYYVEYEELSLEEKYVLFVMHAELALYHLCRAVQTASQITDELYSIPGISKNIANYLDEAMVAINFVKGTLINDMVKALGEMRYEIEEKMKKEQKKTKKAKKKKSRSKIAKKKEKES